MATVRQPDPAEYRVIKRALSVLERILREPGEILGSPLAVSAYLRLHMASLDYEVFHVLYLDAQNRLIAGEELFRGTLTQTSVYPREVLKGALLRGAAGLIVAHNHPSGMPEPSPADEALTRTLKEALALVDVHLLDHIIVAGNRTVSFAERGLI